MIGFFFAALLAVSIDRALRERRRTHRPRALELVKQLPPAPMSFKTAVMCGKADFKSGQCVRCGAKWDPSHVNERICDEFLIQVALGLAKRPR